MKCLYNHFYEEENETNCTEYLAKEMPIYMFKNANDEYILDNDEYKLEIEEKHTIRAITRSILGIEYDTDIPEPPIDIFHDKIQAIIKEREAKETSRTMSVGLILALCSTCIGRSYSVVYDEDWVEHANLYILNIAKSGGGKSRSVDYIFQVLKKIQNDMSEIYKKEYLEYKEKKKNYDFASKKEKAELEIPIEPKKTRYFLEDSTIEAAFEKLNENQRGLLWKLDEFNGFFNGLGRYNKDDAKDGKNKLISSWRCEGIVNSRKRKDNVDPSYEIPSACINILGNLQANIVKKNFSREDLDQGLPQRFLYFWTKAPQEHTRRNSQDKTKHVNRQANINTINLITTKLLSLPAWPVYFDFDYAHRFKLENDAAIEFDDYCDFLSRKTFGDDEATSFSTKLENMILKLVLNLHLLDWAVDENYNCDDENIVCKQENQFKINKYISLETMKKAIKLVDWLELHTRYTRKVLTSIPLLDSENNWREKDDVDKLLSFIEKAENAKFCTEYHIALDIFNRLIKQKINIKTSHTDLGRFFSRCGIDSNTNKKTRTRQYRLISLSEKYKLNTN
jgi:hypothetical protein